MKRPQLQLGDDWVSLAEINSTIEVPPRTAGFWKSLAAYTGPGFLVAVGYMDPGNWVTSIGGGQASGYLLISVILLSSLTAMLLQHLAAKLGIVTGHDLAQMTRRYTPRSVSIVLWILAELAIMATDIAEIIGAAIALYLLFGIPLNFGVAITVIDVFLLLGLMRIGFRRIEAFVAALIAVIAMVFVYEVCIAGPDFSALMFNMIPRREVIEHENLTLALGIVGATVMPHNLYLHSSIVLSRKLDRLDSANVRRAIRFSTIDSNLQLSIAFLVNSLLLILGAAMFYGKNADLSSLESLYNALEDPAIAGAIASPLLAVLFAVALLASGQNSTITGTLAGQIIMEAFLRIRIPIWVRRIVTRLLAVIPVLAFAIMYKGDPVKLEQLLINSQVFLSIELPFSVLPLVYFTARRKFMGEFANRPWMNFVASFIAVVLTVLNLKLIVDLF